MSETAPSADGLAVSRRWRALSLISLAVVMTLCTWFSVTAVMPQLLAEMAVSHGAAAWLANGVQLGFVVGALAASLVNLPDIVRLNRLMAVSAMLAAAANATLVLEPGIAGAVAGRFVTGAALAGVYPPALKLVSTWFRRGRGFAIGVLIGAITLGSALPHLVRASSTALPSDAVVLTTSGAALLGALLFLFAREGPYPFGRAVFRPRQIGAVLRERPLRLVTAGYLGHMWELYAMWAWVLAFVGAAFETQGVTRPAMVSLAAFAVVASGALGCLAGGMLSDRIGRTLTTAVMMMLSGLCALAIGGVFDGPTWLFLAIAVVWGITIVADSAQFSVAVTELADPRYVGTALSLQLGLGFGLTILTIWAMPLIVTHVGGWRWAFAPLAIGPLLGAAAMLRLRALPASARMAGGLR